MTDRYCIVIDERDQKAELDAIKRVLKKDHGINFIVTQINPSLPRFQQINEKTNKPESNLPSIKDAIEAVHYFRRADTIAVDFNLIDGQLNGYEVILAIRELGYKQSKDIILYSAGIEKAIEFALLGDNVDRKIEGVKKLMNGNITFTKRDDYKEQIIQHIRKSPPFDFDDEICSWLLKFGDCYFIAGITEFENKRMDQIAIEIQKSTPEGLKFKRLILEQLFSLLIDLNNVAES